MCIALISTAHPDYALVLINNRDEYLHRPTASASWWGHPNEHVLGGHDLLRSVHGTWLGITKQGRIAVLTNFREEGKIVQEIRSRGAMVNAFLTQPVNTSVDTTEFVRSLVEEGEGLNGVGGFSLICGMIGSPLAVVSNRTPSVEGVTWVANRKGETFGLSNAIFSDRSWPKVLKGEEGMAACISRSIARNDTKQEFIEEMMQLLSTDTLPRRSNGQTWANYIKKLQNSIFIPVIAGEGMDGVSVQTPCGERSDQPNVQENLEKPIYHDGLSGVYGTQTQTVILVDYQGRVTFIERRLFDSEARPISGEDRDRVFEFTIDDWR